VKDLLLVGAGHAHAVLLAEFARQPLFGARLTLVAPHRAQLYSGMIPGVIAGHYRPDEARMDIARLAERAFAEFVQGEVESIDAAARKVRLKGGRELAYGYASLNVGSRVEAMLPGAAEHAVAVRPFEEFMRRLATAKVREVAVIGGGAAGAEVAMAIRHHGAGVTLYSDRMAFAPALGRRVAAALRRQGVDYRQGIAADAIEPGPVVRTGASRQSFDLAVLATGAVAHPWLRPSGLATDARGFVLVDALLRSVSHPEVYAVGDCATLQGATHDKSGVYSVRHGETLAANFRRMIAGEAPQPYSPQRATLVLLGTGGRKAIASRGNWTAEGGWVWRWKDWLDRRWVRRVAGER
jgi:pyridine nucleotide-disulfide oxidoreductase family protein